jgi:hypothetical protein
MCPLARWASSGVLEPRAWAASEAEARYAMNMRAAEATVSSAPKPMKIFPINEV